MITKSDKQAAEAFAAQPHPTFDADGYPTDETESAIRTWDFRDAADWLEYVSESWNQDYGRLWHQDGKLHLATGGWSGNESIVRAMRKNYILWSMLWESSHRGGLEVLRLTPTANCDLGHIPK